MDVSAPIAPFVVITESAVHWMTQCEINRLAWVNKAGPRDFLRCIIYTKNLSSYIPLTHFLEGATQLTRLRPYCNLKGSGL